MPKNKNITCVAVDDEPFALEIIKNFCNKIQNIELICFNNSIEAYEFLSQNSADILFLDIVMPDISGLEIAKMIKKIPYIIFTTAHKEYAVESYEYNTVDYLLKPFDFSRFNKALQKAISLINQNNKPSLDDTITVSVEYQNIIIPIADIKYIESMGNYTKIFTNDKCIMPQLSIKAILELINNNKIVRVHKSYAVNTQYISSYNKSTIFINDIQIPIGKTYNINL